MAGWYDDNQWFVFDAVVYVLYRKVYAWFLRLQENEKWLEKSGLHDGFKLRYAGT